MKLPTSFKLVNRTYEVVPMHEDTADAGDKHGDCDQAKARIRVHITENAELTEHTYFHELAHALLFATTKPKLSYDEKFVDSLGAVLHQYEQTKRGTFKGES